jgi:hypothetical protein
MLLKVAHLAGNRTMGHAQLGRGLAQVAMARCHLKGTQRVEGQLSPGSTHK